MSDKVPAGPQQDSAGDLSAHLSPPLPVATMEMADQAHTSHEKKMKIMEMTQRQYLQQPPGPEEKTAAPPRETDASVTSELRLAEVATHSTADLASPEPSPSRPRKRPAAKSLLRQIGQIQSFRKSKVSAPEDSNRDSEMGKKSEKPVSRKKKAPAGLASPRSAATSTKATKRKPVQKKASAVKRPRRSAPEPVWEGSPTESLEGGWPLGWKKKIFERKSGATKGGTDRYWYSPIKSFKLRSMVEGMCACLFRACPVL